MISNKFQCHTIHDLSAEMNSAKSYLVRAIVDPLALYNIIIILNLESIPEPVSLSIMNIPHRKESDDRSMSDHRGYPIIFRPDSRGNLVRETVRRNPHNANPTNKHDSLDGHHRVNVLQNKQHQWTNPNGHKPTNMSSYSDGEHVADPNEQQQLVINVPCTDEKLVRATERGQKIYLSFKNKPEHGTGSGHEAVTGIYSGDEQKSTSHYSPPQYRSSRPSYYEKPADHPESIPNREHRVLKSKYDRLLGAVRTLCAILNEESDV